MKTRQSDHRASSNGKGRGTVSKPQTDSNQPKPSRQQAARREVGFRSDSQTDASTCNNEHWFVAVRREFVGGTREMEVERVRAYRTGEVELVEST